MFASLFDHCPSEPLMQVSWAWAHQSVTGKSGLCFLRQQLPQPRRKTAPLLHCGLHPEHLWCPFPHSLCWHQTVRWRTPSSLLPRPPKKLVPGKTLYVWPSAQYRKQLEGGIQGHFLTCQWQGEVWGDTGSGRAAMAGERSLFPAQIHIRTHSELGHPVILACCWISGWGRLGPLAAPLPPGEYTLIREKITRAQCVRQFFFSDQNAW